MLTIKQGLKISAIVDKLELKITNPDGKPEEVGSALMMQVVSKAYKAENEILSFVAEVKKCSVEDAGNIDLIAFIKEIAQDTGLMNFFKSAVKSKDRE